MKTLIKRSISVLISAALAILSPGLASYDAFAQITKSQGGAKHIGPIGLIHNIGADTISAPTAGSLFVPASAIPGDQTLQLHTYAEVPGSGPSFLGGQFAGQPLLQSANVSYVPGPQAVAGADAAQTPIAQASVSNNLLHKATVAVGSLGHDVGVLVPHNAVPDEQAIRVFYDQSHEISQGSIAQVVSGQRLGIGSYQRGLEQHATAPQIFAQIGIPDRLTRNSQPQTIEHLAWINIWVAGVAVTALVTLNKATVFSALRRLFRSKASVAERAQNSRAPLPDPVRTFLKSAYRHQFGSWIGAVLTPIVIANFASPDPKVAAQVALGGQFALFSTLFFGNLLGAYLAKKYSSKTTFILAQAVTGGSLLLVLLATGFSAVHPTLFAWTSYLARALTGLFGGAALNVGSQEIIPRLTGDSALNKEVNARYGIAFNSMAAVASVMIALLVYYLPIVTGIWIAGGLAIVALVWSMYFMWQVQLRSEKLVNGTQPEPVDRETVTTGHKIAHGFLMFIATAFFGFFGPFLGMLVPGFGKEMQGYLISGFAIGGLVVSYLISKQKKDSLSGVKQSRYKMWWLGGNVLSWALFFAANLGARNRWLAITSAIILGFANAGALVQWRTFLQSNSVQKDHGKIFKRISDLATASLLSVFVILRGYPLLSSQWTQLPNWPLLNLLTFSFWVISGAAIVAFLFAWRGKPSAQKKP